MIESSMAEPVITPFQTYLILQMDSISKIGGLSLVALSITLFVVAFLRIVGSKDFSPDALCSLQKFLHRGVTVFCLLVLLIAFLPSSKNMEAAIMIPYVVNSLKTNKTPQELLELLKSSIHEWKLKGDDCASAK